MHATIDVRFELSIDDDKTLPLATLAEAVTDQNLEAVLLESLVESPTTPPASRRSVVRNTHMATVTSASNAPGTDTRTAVTTAGEHEFSLHYVEDTAASPDESSYFRPVEDVLDFDGQNRYQQDIAAKASISLPRSAIETLPITATASSRCRRRPPSTAVPRNTATSSNSSFQTVSLAQTLTPSFLTGQSATAKTTTARPTPSKQRSAKTPPEEVTLPAGSVGQR